MSFEICHKTVNDCNIDAHANIFALLLTVFAHGSVYRCTVLGPQPLKTDCNALEVEAIGLKNRYGVINFFIL